MKETIRQRIFLSPPLFLSSFAGFQHRLDSLTINAREDIRFHRGKIDSDRITMQRNSVLFDQYLAQLNSLNRSSEPISPLHAAADPRFSTLMVRASIVQERAKQHQVSPENPVHSPSIVTVNSNAWLPTATPEKKSPINQK